MIAILASVAIALMGLSGFASLAWPRGSVTGDRLAGGAMCVGAVLGTIVAGAAIGAAPSIVHIGLASLRLDALSAFFLLQLFVIAACSAVSSSGAWSPLDHPESSRRLRIFFGISAAGLGLVFLAGDLLTLLVGWEVMTVGAFLAITVEDREPAIRATGRLYLFCTKVGTLALMALCVVWSAAAGSLALVPIEVAPASVFLLAVVAFGLKAGVMPLHVWLPSAHASAPSHVSAFMSGVLIKVGIYGLVRVLGLCGAAPAWWGHVLFGLGAASSVLGVVFAIGQHDIKRLLAYHSIENIGIIFLGLGLATTGRAGGQPALVVLGLAGALLHTWNHGLFKALLFLAAGVVVRATHVRDLDRLGGLARRLPATSLAFLWGAVAICGLPPLNGFVSEFLVYSALIGTLAQAEQGRVWLLGALGTPALALTGALALLCFAKVYGLAFLGEPRTAAAADAAGEDGSTIAPMAVLAALCTAIGVAPALLIPVLDRAAGGFTSDGPSVGAFAPLGSLSVVALVLSGLLALVAGLVARGLHRARHAVTWDCGYAVPSPRMQYTPTSFAKSIVSLFTWALVPVADIRPVGSSPAPPPARVASHVRDPVLELLLLPVSRRAAHALFVVQSFRRGSLHAAILQLLVALVLILALAWI